MINKSYQISLNDLIQSFYIYKLMEYQTKKEQILSTVQYTNLLSFNLVQNKLERNFKSIVEALLLNQTKTDDIISKSDQLQAKLTSSALKNHQDIDSIKNALKQFNDRIAKLQASAGHQPTVTHDIPSSKIEKEQKKQESMNHVIPTFDPPPLAERSSLYDKKFDDIDHQINTLKQKMPGIELMENQLQNMKRQLTALKGQLITYANRSNKNLKRQSISNNIGQNVQSRRQSAIKGGRGSILHPSNSSAGLLKESQNKQNKHSLEVKDSSSGKIEGGGDKCETDYEKEIEGLHFQVNTLNLCYQELKVLVEDLRKKDIKAHSLLSQIEDKQKKLQEQTRKDTQNFERQIKNIQISMINSDNSDSRHQSEQKKVSPRSRSPTQTVYDQNNINYKNQLNDRISKLQNSLQGFITQTEFTRFKTETRGRLDELEKKHQKLVNEYEQQLKKIYDMFINKDLDINRLGELINSTTQIIKENSAQADRKHNIAIARVQQLKKGLQNLREDIQFYQSMNAEKEKKVATESDKPTQKQAEGASKQKGIDSKSSEDLKKYFNNKLHDQRAYLVGLVRELQKKQSTANGVSQQIANLWDKINEINLFLGKKADSDDIKKNLIYLEKKINRLSAHLMKGEDNTQDARIAKTNWFCLSCDKNLLGYQGKIGRHVVWDQMPLKGMVKNTIQKKGLPSLKSK